MPLTNLFTLADDRTIAYTEYGDPEGHPFFFAHGGPGSRLEGELYHETAARHGFRLIATDRPGMGRSTYMPDRALLDYPQDLVQLADALGIERFGVLGHSGGGAHTVVCAYAIPDRLTFNIALAGYTNYAELPGAAEMLNTAADRVAVKLAPNHPRLFKFFFELLRYNVDYFPEAFYKALVSSVNDTDRALLADPLVKEQFLADQKEAVRQGGEGASVDAMVHYVDWGFRLKEIPFRVHIFHGTEDHNVPIAYAEHLAANIPDNELHIMEGQGHLFPYNHQDLIFETARAELRRLLS